jgi:AraC-like DNA-binding protein
VQQGEPDVTYRELYGRLEPGALSAAGAATMLDSDAVVLSNFEQGSAASAGARGLCIRYIARGSENYRIGGRGYRVDAGQLMISPQEHGAECEIRRVEAAGTLGMCTLVRGATAELDWAFGPLVLGGSCNILGPMLRKTAEQLWKGAGPKNQVASQFVAGLRGELPIVVNSLLAQTAAVDGAKPGTRYEMVRRANLAQAYLHSVTGRAVDLSELSAVVGASPFRLLQGFQQCFGDTPASYHRKLRLELVLQEAKRRGVALGSVCDEFGFADASSFSHAYRRAFGRSPVWRKTGC